MSTRIWQNGPVATLHNGNAFKWQIFDVGGPRCERRKWVHCFPKTSLVIFTVDIGAYNQCLFEDENVNRMEEALVLFDSLVNSKWFINTEFILCLTKQLKLAAKLKQFPMKSYYPDCEAEDIGGVTDYFQKRFISLNVQNKPVYTLVLEDLPQKEDWEAIKLFGYWVYEGCKGEYGIRDEFGTVRLPIPSNLI